MSEFSNKGFSHDRTLIKDGSRHVERERAFANTWLEENPTLGYGCSPTLPALVPDCTQRDATVAATMMQWLGSPVGFNFLNKALANAGYKIIEESLTYQQMRLLELIDAAGRENRDYRLREIEHVDANALVKSGFIKIDCGSAKLSGLGHKYIIEMNTCKLGGT